MKRRLFTVALSALLLALTLAVAPAPRTAQADDVTADDLGEILTAYLAKRPDLTTCEVIGDVFWDREPEQIAGVYMALERTEAEYVTLLMNAGAGEPQAKMVAKGLNQGNPLFLAMMLQQGRIDKLRALNSVRFATLLEDRSAEGGKNVMLLRECLAAIVNLLGVAPDDLVETLEGQPSLYDMPEDWQRPTVLPGSQTWAFTPAGERIPVITLRGDPMTRGYSYGTMVADKLVDGWKNYVLGLAGDFYPFIANVQDVTFSWPERYLLELKGMYLAILDCVPEAVRKDNPLGRDFEIRDLMAANTLPDWRALACSSISVWGDRLAPEFAGGTLTARNLDYAPGPGRSIFDLHAIVAYQLPEDEGRSWLSVGWAGLNGCFSAMDEDGVTAFIHDSTGEFTVTTGITPRTYALRLGLETREAPKYTADGERKTDPADEFAAVLREHQNLLSTNVHVSWPAETRTITVTNADGTTSTETITLQSAAGLEYDGTIKGDNAESGVTVRRCGHNPNDDDCALIVTNHFCTRFDAEFHTGDNSGQRYRLLETASGKAQTEAVDVETMRRWLQAVGHSMSLHSVIAAPNLRRMWVCFPNAQDKGAPWVEPLELDVLELLGGTRD